MDPRYIVPRINDDGTPCLFNRATGHYEEPPPAPDLPPVPCHLIAQGAARWLAERARRLYHDAEIEGRTRMEQYTRRRLADQCMRASGVFGCIASEGRSRAA